jgi:hypothetical protein
VGDVFKDLADPTHRTILDELTDRNGQTLFEICARLTNGMARRFIRLRAAIGGRIDTLPGLV